MHGGGRVGLPVEARRHGSHDRSASGMAGPLNETRPTRTEPAQRAGATIAGERANILVVDDRPDKHVVFKAILDELDQNLVHVNSGEEALKQVLRRDFAVILL